MRKRNSIISVLVLLAIILATFGYVVLKSQALSDEDNYFNQNLRSGFAASLFWRQILDLHLDGDGKADYLRPRYKQILIEVDIMQGLSAQISALNLLKDKIQQITGKPTDYIISDRNVRYFRDLNTDQIDDLVDQYQIRETSGDTAVVYLLYASRSQEDSGFLGLTHREYGIVLFAETLQEFSKDDSGIRANYEVSTALHEFGHQLGLDHNDRPGCLMNEDVEIGRFWERPEDVIVDFCEFEKMQIANRE